MVGETHQERLEYAREYFRTELIVDKHNCVWSDFKEIRINNLKSKLIEIGEKSEGTIPDLLMISHSSQNIDLSRSAPEIPQRIFILWIEVFETSFRGFPKEKDAIDALYQLLTWKDLYDSESLQSGLFGQRIKINQKLYESFEHHSTEIFVKFYIVQSDSIWECSQII